MTKFIQTLPLSSGLVWYTPECGAIRLGRVRIGLTPEKTKTDPALEAILKFIPC